MIIPFFGLQQMPHAVVLGIYTLGSPALEDGQQAGITLSFQPLIAGLLDPPVKQPTMVLQLLYEFRMIGQIVNLVRIVGQIVQFLRLFFGPKKMSWVSFICPLAIISRNFLETGHGSL